VVETDISHIGKTALTLLIMQCRISPFHGRFHDVHLGCSVFAGRFRIGTLKSPCNQGFLAPRRIFEQPLIITVLLFYPLFVFSWNHLLEFRVLQRLMERTHKAAEANRPLIRRYGIIGLFAFVWLPFWMTGPIVGCVIGFLMHLHPWLNVGVVLGGTYLAIIFGALLLREVYAQIETYSVYAPLGMLAIIILLVVAGNLIAHRHQHKDSASEGED
jgi:uncharacterized membrane protein